MTTSVLYSSTDAGSPQLNNTPGSLITVLDACLVNGYGAKASLGWTKPFYDTSAKIAVYRNDYTTGTGFFLRVHDNNQIPSSAAHGGYWLRLFSSMSSLDFGIDPLPLIASGMSSGIKTFEGNPVKWRLLGDSRGFYFLIYPYPTSPELAYVFYCGDIISIVPRYTDMYGLFANYGALSYFGTQCSDVTGTMVSGSTSLINKNPFSLKFGAVEARLFTNFQFANPTLSKTNLGIMDGYVEPINDVPFCSDVSVVIQDRKVVGRLPGLEAPLVKYSAQTIRTDVQEKFFYVDGKLKMRVGINFPAYAAAATYDYNPIIILSIGSGFRL